MDYAVLHDRVVLRLERLVESRFGASGKPQAQESLGFGSTFFTDLRRQKARLPMDKIAQLLEVLGEHPAVFFYEALRDGDLRALPESRRDLAPRSVRIPDRELDEQVARILGVVEDRMGEFGNED